MANSMIHADDAISTRFFAQWLSERYPFSLDKFVAIQEPTIDKILADERFERTMKLGGGYTNYLAMNDEALIIVTKREVEGDKERSESYFELFAKDIDTYRDYFDFTMELDEASKLDTLVVEYHSIYLDQYKHINSNAEYFETSIFDEVIDAFYAPYLDTELLFEQFMQSRSAMLQLTGKPGIGKSKLIALFVKHLIAHPEYRRNSDNVIKIARPASSDILAEEEFWVKLRQDGFQALILDDVDHILQKRNESIDTEMEKLHNEIVRKILTFTDGLSSQKSKILISTNLEYHRIDKALIRDFRLFDSIELRPLKVEEAARIWSKTFGLDKGQFDETFEGLTEITAAKLSKEIESHVRIEQEGSGDAPKSYLKEEGISKVKGLRERRERAGLV
jgi:SpoVK/Ycf46/Vps4 family AAA+-type ATPase